MPQVSPACPHCGAQVVAPQAPAYRFFCPQCRRIVAKDLPSSATDAVSAANPAAPALASSNQEFEPSSTATRGPLRKAVLLLGAVAALLGTLATGTIVIIALMLFRPDDPNPEPPPQDNPWGGKSGPAKTLPSHPRQKEIDEAVKRGVDHLKNRLKEQNGAAGADAAGRFADAAPLGRSALAGLALLEAGVRPSDPAIQKALDDVRAGGPQLEMIYALGAVLLFLNRLDDEAAIPVAKDRDLRDTLTLRLVAGQKSDGLWTYINPAIKPHEEMELRRKLESNTYRPTGSIAVTSRSMAQFALLALWGSHRHKLPVRPALLAAAASFHETQKADGTWDYGASRALHDSNTCAGLMALAMERVLRDDRGQPAKKNWRSAGQSQG